jgi:hypothetical protein
MSTKVDMELDFHHDLFWREATMFEGMFLVDEFDSDDWN